MNPNATQESIYALLEHMRTLLAAITQIQIGQVSMYQTQLDTLIASMKGKSPVPKLPPVYDHNPGLVDSNKIIDYISSVGAKRYRYATAALSLNKFDHATGKVLKIMTSLAERSDKSRWGSGTRSITKIKVVPKTYSLFFEYGQFMVKELTSHIKVYVDAL